MHQNLGAGWLSSWWVLSSWLIERAALSLCSHLAFPPCVCVCVCMGVCVCAHTHTQKENTISGVSSCKDTSPIRSGLHPMTSPNPKYIWRPHFQILIGCQGFNLTNFARTQTFSSYPQTFLIIRNPLNYSTKTNPGTFLVTQWLRIHLPMQGTLVRSRVQELGSNMQQTIKPARHNYWAHTGRAHVLQLRPNEAQNLKKKKKNK